MDLVDLHRRTVDTWMSRVAAVGDEQWALPTPCSEWDVRALVNHVVVEGLWTAPLLQGKTIEEVGDAFDGDVLGDDPKGAAARAAGEALESAAVRVPAGGKVHLSYGDEDIGEYIWQLATDHLVHAWDLAKATDGDTTLDAELVAQIAGWFADREEMYRSGGAIGPRTDAGGDPQADLLAAFGRTP